MMAANKALENSRRMAQFIRLSSVRIILINRFPKKTYCICCSKILVCKEDPIFKHMLRSHHAHFDRLNSYSYD